MTKEITSRTIFRNRIQSREKTLVLFRSENCLPCVQVTPFFRKLELDPDLIDFDFLEVIAGAGSKIMIMESINSFPTLIYYRRGIMKESFKIGGITSRSELKKKINKII